MAVRNKQWDLVVQICQMNSPDKPAEASKEFLLNEASKAQNWSDIYTLEQLFKTQDYRPTRGPLPKTEESYELEALFRKLLQTSQFKLERRDGDVYFVFKDKSAFNWSTIKNYANFQHLELTEDDYKAYSQFLTKALNKSSSVQSSSHQKPISEDSEEYYRELIYKKGTRPDNPITYQEMQAINIYTLPDVYSKMNDFLRGRVSTDDDKRTLREILLHSVMCSSGLNKMPQTNITQAYRVEALYSNTEYELRVKAAAQGGVLPLQGFLSTGINSRKSHKFNEEMSIGEKNDPNEGEFTLNENSRDVHTQFQNLKGVWVAPISNAHEGEFLLPPNTQLRFTEYKEDNEGYYFRVTVASELSSFNPNEGPRLPLTSYSNDFLDKALADLLNKDDLKCTEALDIFNTFTEQHDRDSFFSAMENRWEKMAKTINDIPIILKMLPAEKIASICTSITPQIKTIYDYISLLSKCDPSVLPSLYANIPIPKYESYEIGFIYKLIGKNDPLRTLFTNQQLDNLSTMVRDFEDFSTIFQNLDNNQQIHLVKKILQRNDSKEIKQKLSARENIYAILSIADPKTKLELCEQLREQKLLTVPDQEKSIFLNKFFPTEPTRSEMKNYS